MTAPLRHRGGAPVGLVAELPPVERGAVIYLRLWCEGGPTRARIIEDFRFVFGPEEGTRLSAALDRMLTLLMRHSRRPLMYHSLPCRCLGGDESALANMVAAAASGDHEDARLFALSFSHARHIRAITAAAEDIGLALERMMGGGITLPGTPPCSPHNSRKH